MKIALVGAGTVGTAVTYLLRQKGHEVVAVASRSSESAERAAERLDAAVHAIDDIPPVELLLLGVADAAIEDVAANVAPRVREGTYVCHFAGSFGPGVLKPVLAQGANACAVHPVQACPTINSAVERLPGSAWGVSCSNPQADQRMFSLIEDDLAGYPVVVAEEDRSIWHAAAVATSNGIAALLATGETMLEGIGIADPVRVLGPLAAGTVQNVREAGGGAAALTGPVVRGEKETVRRHVRALRDRPGAFEQYRAAAFLIVQAAVAAGRIDEKMGDEIMAEFSS